MARRKGLLSPTVLLRRNSMYKGFLGSSRGWKFIGVALYGPKVAKRLFGKNEKVVATEILKPGQGLHLQTVPPATRRQRKAARAAR